MQMLAELVRPPGEAEQKSAHFSVLDVLVSEERLLVACRVEHPLSPLAELVPVRDSRQGACSKPAVGLVRFGERAACDG